MRRRPRVLAATALAAVVALAGCTETVVGTAPVGTLAAPAPDVPSPDVPSPLSPESTSTATTPASSAAPMVVETVFGHVDLDPTRQFGGTGAIVAKAAYQTLTTFTGGGQTQPGPGLAQYTLSPEGNWLTLRLRPDARFSDGTRITTDDVIFTLNRALGLDGPAARVLGNITMTKVDDRTMTITSPGSNFALPAILANPTFGILNSALVKARGGTIGPSDYASPWLQTNSAGSGPYVITARTDRTITLGPNPYWSGPAPAHPHVVLRDATPKQQVEDLEARRADIVLDLSPSQAEAIRADPRDAKLQVVDRRSWTTAFLMLNTSPKVNRWTANSDFAEAVRRGIDPAALAEIVGGGTVPASGLIAQGIIGALKPGATNPVPTPLSTGTSTPTPPRGPAAPPDLGAARAALKRAGYAGEPLTLTYAEGRPIQGVPPRQLAEAVARQLREVGITVRPEAVPAAAARSADQNGTQAFALSSFTPDFPGPENYLLFAPGHPIGVRAAWRLRANPVIDELTIAALNSVGADRQAAYAAWQQAMNTNGPFVPLVQPTSHYAHDARVSSVATNPTWTIDLAQTR